MGRAQLQRELAGIALLVAGAFLLGALVFGGAADGARCSDGHGLFGPVGACARAALVVAVGLPSALLVPAAALVHGLRLLGRLEARTDRSWLVFLVGSALLLPIALGLAAGPSDVPRASASTAAGLWGDFLAFYMVRGFGAAGSWLIVLLALSALTAVTLAWNPLRMLVGRPRAVTAVAGGAGRATVAARLEPPPEEMPALEPRYVAEAVT
ncbi:MAG TPA: DNA translocase FtsK 4TM domain-containing protein, partial [Gemmatimonadaceae bacterium]|nr:DNA translocase FtsK 4TM domain-containing protein [Gemmatimonadaceae bacterium]